MMKSYVQDVIEEYYQYVRFRIKAILKSLLNTIQHQSSTLNDLAMEDLLLPAV